MEWDAVSNRVYSIWMTTSLTNDYELLINNIAYPQSSYTATTESTNSFYHVKVGLEE